MLHAASLTRKWVIRGGLKARHVCVHYFSPIFYRQSKRCAAKPVRLSKSVRQSEIRRYREPNWPDCTASRASALPRRRAAHVVCGEHDLELRFAYWSCQRIKSVGERHRGAAIDHEPPRANHVHELDAASTLAPGRRDRGGLHDPCAA